VRRGNVLPTCSRQKVMAPEGAADKMSAALWVACRQSSLHGRLYLPAGRAARVGAVPKIHRGLQKPPAGFYCESGRAWVAYSGSPDSAIKQTDELPDERKIIFCLKIA